MPSFSPIQHQSITSFVLSICLSLILIHLPVLPSIHNCIKPSVKNQLSDLISTFIKHSIKFLIWMVSMAGCRICIIIYLSCFVDFEHINVCNCINPNILFHDFYLPTIIEPSLLVFLKMILEMTFWNIVIIYTHILTRIFFHQPEWVFFANRLQIHILLVI